MRKTTSLVVRVVFAVAICIISPSAAGAQRRPVSLDVSVGHGSGAGGQYTDRQTVAVDAVLGLRIHPRGTTSLLAGVAWQRQSTMGDDASCSPAPDGGCLPGYPGFQGAAALVGGEWSGGRGPSVRAWVGPVYYRVVRDGSGGVWGGQARLDLASPALGPVALVASARTDVLGPLQGERLRLAAYSVGVRLQ